ncbi:unnamed protein product [Diabrotica balteata]|uniref:Uncharacterized protein n=1 Tax=Diabrotica balteata TaxID=107213 RepID=A0A9N9XA73_DIABA|nr:unnamed protein product [Diabrotica balteata]
MIYYVITNRDINPSKIIDVRCLNSADVGSDHSLVLCKTRIIRKYFPPKRAAPTQTKIKVEGLNKESTEYLYRKRISKKIAGNEILENDNIWNHLERVEWTWNHLC